MTWNRQVKAQQPRIYAIFKGEKNIALWLDRSNTLKVNSENRVLPFSLNNKPTSVH